MSMRNVVDERLEQTFRHRRGEAKSGQMRLLRLPQMAAILGTVALPEMELPMEHKAVAAVTGCILIQCITGSDCHIGKSTLTPITVCH
jgi:hypothetical protein